MYKNSNNPRMSWWVVGAFALVLLLALGALILTNARTASSTLEEAEGLHTADMTIAAQDVAMKSLGQLVLLAQDHQLGIASQESVDAAESEAQRALAQFDDRVSRLGLDVASSVSGSVVKFRTAADSVIELSTSGEVDDAATQLSNVVVPAAEILAAELTVERDVHAAAIEDAQGRAGRYAQIAAFLTAFLVPLGAIVIYRRSLRRQLEVAETHLDARLDAEKVVGRAKDQFIASISHELRTPLTSIYGFSEVLLEQGLLDPDSAGDLIGLINTESGELTRMVEDLLVAAHDEDVPLPMNRAEVRIDEEIDSVVRPFARNGIMIGGTYAPALVVGDQLRIRQILRNLLSNAVKHGGPSIRVYGDVAGSNYAIAVEDDGDGVPDDVRERMFTRFVHQGDTALTSGSVGLGLAVARLLAEAMGGSLEYDYMAGRTSFVLMIPLAESEQGTFASDDMLVPTNR